MKTFFSVLLFALQCFFICLTSFAQNLVPNHSFEVYDSCPDAVSQIIKSLNWYQPTTGTPDYYNSCYTGPSSSGMGVPANFLGFQYPKSGNAYAGLITFYNPVVSYREYIEVRLLQPLIANVKYYIHFYVSLADSSYYATDDFGLYLSKDSIFSNNYDVLNYVPQLENPEGNYVKDTMNWTMVKGEYEAKGGEQFLVIGNFKDIYNTDSIKVRNVSGWLNSGFVYAYYYLDEVCVSADSSMCDYEVGIDKTSNENSIQILPNPFISQLSVESLIQIKQIEILNLLGQLVYYLGDFASSQNHILDLSNLPSGNYLVKIKTEKKVFIEKVTKQNR